VVKRIIQWFNKPMPRIICQVIKKCEHCKADWPVIFFFAAIVIFFVYILPFIGKLFS